MLRNIEEESEKEQKEQEEIFARQHKTQGNDSPYWNNLNNQNSFNPPTPHPYNRETNYSSNGEGFEAPLKDFNSAFRQTPLPPQPVEGTEQVPVEEERGINWSSVLSLSSQSDLDPLNNNTYPGSWNHSSQELTDVDLSQHTFDDINWKLTPVSADDVLKVFPNDENLFQCVA